MISNVPEDITSSEIENILNSAVINSTEEISIQQEKKKKSRLVKNIPIDKVLEIVKKVDNMSFKGNIIHCRPHVPSTPPKVETVAAEVKVDGKKETPKPKEKENPTIKVTSAIPGLAEKDVQKALKAANRKQKKIAEKERKKNKKAEVKINKKLELDQSDFLVNKTPTNFSVVDDYQFSDYSDDSDGDEVVFEDSKEIQSEDEFLTPINFTSVFGKRTAALSTSTPNLSVRNTSKREASSPPGSTKSKKPRSKSSLPVRSKK